MIDKKQTLVILSPGFPENEEDTTCLPAHQVFVRALNKNFPNLNVIIITFEYPLIACRYTWNGNNVTGLGGKDTGKINHILTWLKALNAIRKIKNKNDVIGILSFWITQCALVGKYAGKMYNLKHYSWITGQDAKKNNVFVKLIRPRIDEIFAMSDFFGKSVLPKLSY